MKNEMCAALIILAALPLSAQNVATANCPADRETVTAQAEPYAASVGGLLREVHASLQDISEREQAGSLTAEQARALKLAATRDMIARLDAISAVYEMRANSKDNSTENGSAMAASVAQQAGRPALHTGGTVSVEELRRESAAVAAVAGETSNDGN